MDLSPYIAKGFPGVFDQAIAEVGVAGIDKQQSQSTVRLCPDWTCETQILPRQRLQFRTTNLY